MQCNNSVMKCKSRFKLKSVIHKTTGRGGDGKNHNKHQTGLSVCLSVYFLYDPNIVQLSTAWEIWLKSLYPNVECTYFNNLEQIKHMAAKYNNYLLTYDYYGPNGTRFARCHLRAQECPGPPHPHWPKYCIRPYEIYCTWP